MLRLAFHRDIQSIDLLDKILYSYPGWESGTVMSEPESMLALLALLECQAIRVTAHPYVFRPDIREDPDSVSAYQELLPKTRWKQHGEHETIRLNVLWQLRHLGTPDYQEYIQYQDGACEALCGNLSPAALLSHLANTEGLRRFYIFPYPYWNEDRTADYYCFAFTPRAVNGAKRFQEHVWDRIRAASGAGSIFSDIPDEQTSSDLPCS